MVRINGKGFDMTKAGEATIGLKEIMKGVEEGRIKKVLVASNCPEELRKKLPEGVAEPFEGNEKQLGTKLGKPFAVAMAGYEE